MKKFKLLAAVLATVAALSATFGLVACNSNDGAYVFEAEYVDVSGLEGKGFSNNAAGIDMISPDTPDNDDYEIIIGQPGKSKASNGFYLNYLYSKGITVTFNITSDVEVTDATLIMRLSGEFVETVECTDEEWVVKVNGEQIKYGGFKITGIDTDKANEVKKEFKDFTVTTSLHLVAGENVITFTVNNNRSMGGTASATAPLFDCIKIDTTAKLTWNPVKENLADYELEEE